MQQVVWKPRYKEFGNSHWTSDQYCWSILLQTSNHWRTFRNLCNDYNQQYNQQYDQQYDQQYNGGAQYDGAQYNDYDENNSQYLGAANSEYSQPASSYWFAIDNIIMVIIINSNIADIVIN